jgi:hypothetical protein
MDAGTDSGAPAGKTSGAAGIGADAFRRRGEIYLASNLRIRVRRLGRFSGGNEMTTILGGCLCGAVRYTAEADPASGTVCHCRDCQRFTGSAFAALVRASKENVRITGTLKTFSSIGGSGNPILRHFCPECGSSIAEEPGARSGILVLNVGTFDDPALAKPSREIFRDDALPWVEVHGDIPRFPKRAS